MSDPGEGWGGGLRKLHWITEDGARCNQKLVLLAAVEFRSASESYVAEHGCKRCQAALAYRSVR